MINIPNEESINQILSLEKKSLSATLDIQKTFNKQILMYMKNILGNVEYSFVINPESKVFKYLNISTQTLSKSNENLLILEGLLKDLNLVETTYSTDKTIIKKYNSAFKKGMSKMYINTKIIEEYIHTSSITDFTKILKDQKVERSKNSIDQFISNEDLKTSFVENTLVISETRRKVILPYRVEDLKDIFLENSNNYESLNDVIRAKYTKPISYFKPSPNARFREAYRLMTKKEKKSPLKAFSLAMELFANYNLHPAVITACENLDQLDIYLACLEDNSLQDFKYFNVKFEIPPAKEKKILDKFSKE